ncbi:MAG TPA: DUF1501 domain-containing protein [Methylomirabilota bacterium]|nr:DUF1501 domain-containing protein [Methylomirabilota bacterium]
MNTFNYTTSRRRMLKMAGCGFGYLALSSLLSNLGNVVAAQSPLAAKTPPLAAKAKRIIFLFMHGGPSHVDTFDHRPLLARDAGKPLPKSLVVGSSDPNGKLMPSPFEFKKHGQGGVEISEIWPELATCADDLCVVRSMHTNGQDHGQAVLKLHTGAETQLRPSMGAWVIYGLGTENQNLPGFITISPPQFNGGVQNYGSAFLPAVYQGTPIGRAEGRLTDAQIRHIKNLEFKPDAQRQQIDFLQQLNRDHLKQANADLQIEGIIESYELAFRMQAEAPGITDFSEETEATRKLYGIDETPTDTFGRQCLLARRFAERGVRFIQVSHAFKWDQHQELTRDHRRNAREVDKPIAGLLKDLKARGLLKDTLVLWGGEFGRTPTGQGNDGRDHNPHAFSIWMAGGGVKPGFTYGSTDDYGNAAVVDKVHMHDLHATLLHLLGLDHQSLTFRHGGRDYRLTDVHGNVVKPIVG